MKKEQLKEFGKHIVNWIVIAALFFGAFWAGVLYTNYKHKQESIPNFNYLNEQTNLSVSVNQSNQLLIIDKINNKCDIYDSITTQSIFKLVANKLINDETSQQIKTK